MIATIIAGPDGVTIRVGETFARHFEFGTRAAEWLLGWIATGKLEGHEPEALNRPAPLVAAISRLNREKPDLPKLYREMARGPRSGIAMSYRLSWRLDARGAA